MLRNPSSHESCIPRTPRPARCTQTSSSIIFFDPGSQTSSSIEFFDPGWWTWPETIDAGGGLGWRIRFEKIDILEEVWVYVVHPPLNARIAAAPIRPSMHASPLRRLEFPIRLQNLCAYMGNIFCFSWSIVDPLQKRAGTTVRSAHPKPRDEHIKTASGHKLCKAAERQTHQHCVWPQAVLPSERGRRIDV